MPSFLNPCTTLPHHNVLSSISNSKHFPHQLVHHHKRHWSMIHQALFFFLSIFMFGFIIFLNLMLKPTSCEAHSMWKPLDGCLQHKQHIWCLSSSPSSHLLGSFPRSETHHTGQDSFPILLRFLWQLTQSCLCN